MQLQMPINVRLVIAFLVPSWPLHFESLGFEQFSFETNGDLLFQH